METVCRFLRCCIMEVASVIYLCCTWSSRQKVGREPKRFSEKCREECSSWMLMLMPQSIALKALSSYSNSPVSALKPENVCISCDEALVLKKSQELAPYLNGRCIYLVGMMGSGKTTVGKILSEVLGYSFFDSDRLVEQAVGGTSVAQIFMQYNESFFRENESEVLRKLSPMHRLVVATGGGSVIRPINWEYVKQGITVWLDVPSETLARRIAAVGIDSRPLLHEENQEMITQRHFCGSQHFLKRGAKHMPMLMFGFLSIMGMIRLTCILYADIADKLGHKDVSDLTPTAIAIETLEQIGNLLKDDYNMAVARNS